MSIKKGPKQGVQSKYYCFTVNNPTAIEDEEFFFGEKEFVWEAPWPYWEGVTYVHWSYEVGEKGTKHIQGYLELQEKKRITALKKLKGLERAHFEMRRGTQAEAINYCEKPLHPELFTAVDIATHIAGPYFNGEKSKNTGVGKAKTDNKRVIVDKVRSGGTDAELWDEFPGAMWTGHRAVPLIREVFTISRRGPRDKMPTVWLFVGLPGTGKSRTAKIIASSLGDIYVVQEARGSGLYWDGYRQEESVIIDDMDGSLMKPAFFKKLCDRYRFSVAPLGKANVEFNSPNIFITSNSVPKNWWPKVMKSTVELGAIMRRFCVILFFGKSHHPLGEPVTELSKAYQQFKLNGVGTSYSKYFSPI